MAKSPTTERAEEIADIMADRGMKTMADEVFALAEQRDALLMHIAQLKREQANVSRLLLEGDN